MRLALQFLEPEDRYLLLASEVEGLDWATIAAELGLASPDAARVRCAGSSRASACCSSSSVEEAPGRSLTPFPAAVRLRRLHCGTRRRKLPSTFARDRRHEPERNQRIRYGSAQQLLEDLLARDGAPAPADIDALCSAHPDLEREAREILGACVDVDRALGVARASEIAQRAESAATPSRNLRGSRGRPGATRSRAKSGRRHGRDLPVLDRQARRRLAMKVILDRETGEAASNTRSVHPALLARFLEEAQVTGQLDHPGIVPVHEVGIDEQGRAYFTMKLVAGRTLAEIYRCRAKGDPDWSTPKVLGLIQRACEAVAFAHERGVIHRDLKPSNVMVGDFGEVYVMDWGLARRMGRGLPAPPSGEVAAADDELSSLVAQTRDGRQPGTPAYMSPEQAGGRIEEIGRNPTSLIGAMIYSSSPASAVLRARTKLDRRRGARARQRPPTKLAPSDSPPELAAICERAMGARRASATTSAS